MTDAQLTALICFLVEYPPPDPGMARLIWKRIAALLFPPDPDEKG